MNREELIDLLKEKVGNQEKLETLNLEQLQAVYKLRTFLDRKVLLNWKGEVIEYAGDHFLDEDKIASFILDLPESERLEACIQYIYDNSFLLCGPAGTGKTYTSQIGVSGYRFLYCAPTSQACGVLQDSIGAKVSTLASVLGTAKLDRVTNDQNSDDFYLKSMKSIKAQYEFSGDLPGIFRASNILIDECSMVGGNGKPPTLKRIKEDGEYREVQISNDTFIALAGRVLDRLLEFGDLPGKFVFLGDYAQTPPVGTEGDQDAELIETLMKREDQFASLVQVMRTEHPDIIDLTTKYRTEIDRLNLLRIEKGISSANPSAQSNIQVTPYAERVNSENIYYYNNLEAFVDQFLFIYKNRETKDKFNPNYVSIVNFNNENHERTIILVKRIRRQLFGDESQKYYSRETLVLKSTLEIPDRVTGKNLLFEKDSRVFVEKVETGHKLGRLGRSGPSYAIPLPRLTLRAAGKSCTIYAASKHFVDVITTIRNGNRYKNKAMNLLPEEAEFFGLKSLTLSYPHWLELSKLAPDFGYGYVVNNFKVQGSTLEYTMIDESNILTSPSYPKKLIQYVYTGISRGRKKVFIYNKNNKVNSPEPIQLTEAYKVMYDVVTEKLESSMADEGYSTKETT